MQVKLDWPCLYHVTFPSQTHPHSAVPICGFLNYSRWLLLHHHRSTRLSLLSLALINQNRSSNILRIYLPELGPVSTMFVCSSGRSSLSVCNLAICHIKPAYFHQKMLKLFRKSTYLTNNEISLVVIHQEHQSNQHIYSGSCPFRMPTSCKSKGLREFCPIIVSCQQ